MASWKKSTNSNFLVAIYHGCIVLPLCWYTSAEGVQKVACDRTPVTACHWLAARSPLGGHLRERPKPRTVIGQIT